MASNAKLLRICDLHCPVESDHIGHSREEEEHGNNPCRHAAATSHHLPKSHQEMDKFAQSFFLQVTDLFILIYATHKASVRNWRLVTSNGGMGVALLVSF